MQIVIASQNPVKIEAAKIGFIQMFPDDSFEFRGISVSSGVSDQPMSRQETLQGALNRTKNAALAMPQAQYIVGIEGGVEENDGRLEVFAWIVIQNGEQIGRAQTGIFSLPDEVAQLIHEGKELGEADDIIFGTSNSKQANGSIGILTDNAYTRTDYYVNAVIMALIPFKQAHLTWK